MHDETKIYFEKFYYVNQLHNDDCYATKETQSRVFM